MIELFHQILAFWFSLPRPLRFLLVGGFNTVFSFCIFTVLIFCGIKYNVTLVIAYIIGVNCSIFTMQYFVYQSKNHIREYYAKGWITYLSTFLINYIFLYIFIELLQVQPVTAQAVYTVISTIYIYFMHRYFTFSDLGKK